MANKPLRFLVVSSDKFPPFRVDVTVLFGEELSSRGHAMDWLLQSAKACHQPYETTWPGGRAFIGKTITGETRLKRMTKHLLGFLHDLKIFALVRSNQYDFVQVKDKFLAALLAIIASRLYRVKFVYWLSYPFPEASLYAAEQGIARYPLLYSIRGHFLKFLLYRIILPSASHVFVQSEQMKIDVAAMGIPISKLTPVPMGVSLDMFPYKPQQPVHKTGNSSKKIVYIGTLIKARRMEFAIHTLHIIIQAVPEAVLYLIGGSEDATDVGLLKNEAKKLGLEKNVVFTGQISRAEALRYVHDADVCISPFYPTPILNSTSPTKLIEYMAMGKAVVANSHPEQSLVLRESKAGLCVDYDEDHFAEAIVTLLNDPQLRVEMGLRGRQYVEEHRSYGKIAEFLEQQYYEICSNV